MKKLITFLLAVVAFATVHAQSTRQQARRTIFGPSGSSGTRQESRTVVLGDRKTTTYRTYPSNRNDRSYAYEGRKHHKHGEGKRWKHHDNGKHLGWKKGKGNPHHH